MSEAVIAFVKQNSTKEVQSIEITKHSNVNQIVFRAIQYLNENNAVVFEATGPGTQKLVSIVEILKQKIKDQETVQLAKTDQQVVALNNSIIQYNKLSYFKKELESESAFDIKKTQLEPVMYVLIQETEEQNFKLINEGWNIQNI